MGEDTGLALGELRGLLELELVLEEEFEVVFLGGSRDCCCACLSCSETEELDLLRSGLSGGGLFSASL